MRDPLTDLHNRRYLAEDDESTLDELLGRADVQLYASKHAGRNQTSYGQDASNEATPL